MDPHCVTSDDLARWRRRLLRILDELDGRGIPNSGPGARVARLKKENSIPRRLAACMTLILELRNAAEYDAWEPSPAEGEAARNALIAVEDWLLNESATKLRSRAVPIQEGMPSTQMR